MGIGCPVSLWCLIVIAAAFYPLALPYSLAPFSSRAYLLGFVFRVFKHVQQISAMLFLNLVHQRTNTSVQPCHVEHRRGCAESQTSQYSTAVAFSPARILQPSIWDTWRKV